MTPHPDRSVKLTAEEIRAFKVSSEHSEAAVLAFAKSPSVAKLLAKASPWFDGIDYIDLRVRREPKADQFAENGELLLDGETVFSRRTMWLLGWDCLDAARCEECGSSEWDGVPESALSRFGSEEIVICEGCEAAKKEKP